MKEEIIRQLKRTLRVVSGFPSVQIFLNEVTQLFEFADAFRQNQYRDISLGTLFAAAFALLYLISPIDMMPDFIPGIGWIDDIVVVRILLEMIRSDLAKYDLWKSWMEEMSQAK